ncbi:MAG: transcriptional regulator [Candidatus Aminicenantes bacterium]|nr:transcriptional regulator [Candidatus Aminicenantes bacterium]NIM78867.1 transcriptional regulator [Candidatus Aminicenantes bacterium]NIN18123.1 transcriptional regulator [Candidatus Aminicenantes bacterium]NIN42022.1 transcriptional regulator [Candidatus Aminicenantes bacterium]NIN84778.1 transcriptional regulator [Candidatus Aminicenantes bacterium]
MNNKKFKQVLDILENSGIIRPKDLESQGISREYLVRLRKLGLVKRTGRGLYTKSNMKPGEHHSLAEAAKKVPGGVVCLLSALNFHNLTTELPFEVWMAIDVKAWMPKSDTVPLRIVRFSKGALSSGIEEHILEGVKVRIYNPAKTVADCFKYRNKIGLDVALESLRECWRQKLCTIDHIWKYAGICRVSNVIRPYLESLG